MIKLLISLILLFFISSCEIKNINNQKIISESKIKNKEDIANKNSTANFNKNNSNKLKYVLGDTYFIEGVKYIPIEEYNYNKIGLATFYGKELHNKRTLNNDLNKVTELLARHKTLPLPSVVKITNLDNGLTLIVKINDRHNDNSSLIQVSRKTAQLLKFYKNKIAKVRVEVLSDSSKQLKIVTQSMSDPLFDSTIEAAPTIGVSISNMNEGNNMNSNIKNIEIPVEIGLEKIENKDLYLKIYNFNSYNSAKLLISELSILHKFSTQNEGDSYSLIIGPLENIDANKLVLSFISKGYKKTEIILE